MRTSLLLALVFSTLGCLKADEPAAADREARPISATGGETEAQVIEIRTLTIAWSGAQGASEEITRTEAQADARAQNVASLARLPDSNFGEVARAYGDTPPATVRLSRGDSTLPEAVVSEAFRLRVGQRSRAIRTDAGFVVMERLPDPQTGPTEIRARHILVSYVGARMAGEDVTRDREEAQGLAEAIARRARSGEDWDALHRAHSNETNGPEGGDLGRFGRGQMVPAFERAAFGLEVREISDAVESPFGFHVIQRLE
ncbi:MAG: peptidylprolyl isomerase [Sandaracinus sp.]|nr:peptidylprolyl isomerase [Sandaracinus sp.]